VTETGISALDVKQVSVDTQVLGIDVEIVMLEKLDCILSKRATRPIYMRVQVRLNAISPYQSQQSSPAIRDISVSGHTRHLRLRPYETHLRRPVYAIIDSETKRDAL
jgi:hypothetical protein